MIHKIKLTYLKRRKFNCGLREEESIKLQKGGNVLKRRKFRVNDG